MDQPKVAPDMSPVDRSDTMFPQTENKEEKTKRLTLPEETAEQLNISRNHEKDSSKPSCTNEADQQSEKIPCVEDTISASEEPCSKKIKLGSECVGVAEDSITKDSLDPGEAQTKNSAKGSNCTEVEDESCLADGRTESTDNVGIVSTSHDQLHATNSSVRLKSDEEETETILSTEYQNHKEESSSSKMLCSVVSNVVKEDNLLKDSSSTNELNQTESVKKSSSDDLDTKTNENIEIDCTSKCTQLIDDETNQENVASNSEETISSREVTDCLMDTDSSSAADYQPEYSRAENTEDLLKTTEKLSKSSSDGNIIMALENDLGSNETSKTCQSSGECINPSTIDPGDRKEMSEESSEKMSEESNEKCSEKSSEKLPEETSKKCQLSEEYINPQAIDIEGNEEMSEESSENLLEETSKTCQLSEEYTNPHAIDVEVNKEMSGESSEKLSKEITEQSDEKLSKEISEESRDNLPKEILEESSDNLPKEIFEESINTSSINSDSNVSTPNTGNDLNAAKNIASQIEPAIMSSVDCNENISDNDSTQVSSSIPQAIPESVKISEASLEKLYQTVTSNERSIECNESSPNPLNNSNPEKNNCLNPIEPTRIENLEVVKDENGSLEDCKSNNFPEKLVKDGIPSSEEPKTSKAEIERLLENEGTKNSPLEECNSDCSDSSNLEMSTASSNRIERVLVEEADENLSQDKITLSDTNFDNSNPVKDEIPRVVESVTSAEINHALHVKTKIESSSCEEADERSETMSCEGVDTISDRKKSISEIEIVRLGSGCDEAVKESVTKNSLDSVEVQTENSADDESIRCIEVKNKYCSAEEPASGAEVEPVLDGKANESVPSVSSNGVNLDNVNPGKPEISSLIEPVSSAVIDKDNKSDGLKHNELNNSNSSKHVVKPATCSEINCGLEEKTNEQSSLKFSSISKLQSASDIRDCGEMTVQSLQCIESMVSNDEIVVSNKLNSSSSANLSQIESNEQISEKAVRGNSMEVGKSNIRIESNIQQMQTLSAADDVSCKTQDLVQPQANSNTGKPNSFNSIAPAPTVIEDFHKLSEEPGSHTTRFISRGTNRGFMTRTSNTATSTDEGMTEKLTCNSYNKPFYSHDTNSKFASGTNIMKNSLLSSIELVSCKDNHVILDKKLVKHDFGRVEPQNRRFYNFRESSSALQPFNTSSKIVSNSTGDSQEIRPPPKKVSIDVQVDESELLPIDHTFQVIPKTDLNPGTVSLRTEVGTGTSQGFATKKGCNVKGKTSTANQSAPIVVTIRGKFMNECPPPTNIPINMSNCTDSDSAETREKISDAVKFFFQGSTNLDKFFVPNGALPKAGEVTKLCTVKGSVKEFHHPSQTSYNENNGIPLHRGKPSINSKVTTPDNQSKGIPIQCSKTPINSNVTSIDKQNDGTPLQSSKTAISKSQKKNAPEKRRFLPILPKPAFHTGGREYVRTVLTPEQCQQLSGMESAIQLIEYAKTNSKVISDESDSTSSSYSTSSSSSKAFSKIQTGVASEGSKLQQVVDKLYLAQDSSRSNDCSTSMHPLPRECSTGDNLSASVCANQSTVDKMDSQKEIQNKRAKTPKEILTSLKLPSALTVIPQTVNKRKLNVGCLAQAIVPINENVEGNVIDRLKKLGTVIEVECEGKSESKEKSSGSTNAHSRSGSGTSSPAPMQPDYAQCLRVLDNLTQAGEILASIKKVKSKKPTSTNKTKSCLKPLPNLNKLDASTPSNRKVSGNTTLRRSSLPPEAVNKTTSSVSAINLSENEHCLKIASNPEITIIHKKFVDASGKRRPAAEPSPPPPLPTNIPNQSIDCAPLPTKVQFQHPEKHCPPTILITTEETSGSVRSKQSLEKVGKFVFRLDVTQVMEMPGGERVLTCDICSAAYYKVASLKRHYLRKHINDTYISEQDRNSYLSPSKKGRMSAESSSRKPSSKGSNLSKEKSEKEENMKGLFKCSTCRKCFDVKNDLKSHLMEHIPGSIELKTFNCSNCSETFENRKEFVGHRSTCSQKQVPPMSSYFCLYCEQSFMNIASRNKHHFKHHHPKKKYQKCYVCNSEKFREKSTLFRHMCMHHKRKYFGCLHCRLRFGSKGDLDNHNRDIHGTKIATNKSMVTTACEEKVKKENESLGKPNISNENGKMTVIESTNSNEILTNELRGAVEKLSSSTQSDEKIESNLKPCNAIISEEHAKLNTNSELKNCGNIDQLEMKNKLKGENPTKNDCKTKAKKQITNESKEKTEIKSKQETKTNKTKTINESKTKPDSETTDVKQTLDSKIKVENKNKVKLPNQQKSVNKCDTCGKVFSSVLNMSRHVRLAHGFHPRRKLPTENVKIVEKICPIRRETIEEMEKRIADSRERSNMDAETLFYTTITFNIEDNLLHHLDGKLDSQEVMEYDLNTPASPIISKRRLSFSASFSSSSRHSLENLSKATQDTFNALQPISPKSSCGKYTFPKNYDGCGGLTSYIRDMSHLDLCTQMTMRLNLQRPDRREVVSMSSSDVADVPASLKLIKKERNEDSIEEKAFAAVEFSGEWTRPRNYICAVCNFCTEDLWEIEDHKVLKHPNVWCPHHEVLVEEAKCWEVVYKKRPLTLQGSLSGELELHPLLDPAAVPQLRCSKCNKAFAVLADFHWHVLDCGGDTTWAVTMLGVSSPGSRRNRKWRPFGSRRRRQQGRRGLKRNIPNTPARQPGMKIRSKPGDMETIQRMIANLPAKRVSRRVFGDDADVKTRSQGTISSGSIYSAYNYQSNHNKSVMKKQAKIVKPKIFSNGTVSNSSKKDEKKSAKKGDHKVLQKSPTETSNFKQQNIKDMFAKVSPAESSPQKKSKSPEKKKPEANEKKSDANIQLQSKNPLKRDRSKLDKSISPEKRDNLEENNGKKKPKLKQEEGTTVKAIEKTAGVLIVKDKLQAVDSKSGNTAVEGNRSKSGVTAVSPSAKTSDEMPKPKTPSKSNKQDAEKQKRCSDEFRKNLDDMKSKMCIDGNVIICLGCAMRFDNSSACQRHMKKCSYYKEKTAANLSCNHCNASFLSQALKQRHVCEADRTMPQLSPVEPYSDQKPVATEDIPVLSPEEIGKNKSDESSVTSRKRTNVKIEPRRDSFEGVVPKVELLEQIDDDNKFTRSQIGFKKLEETSIMTRNTRSGLLAKTSNDATIIQTITSDNQRETDLKTKDEIKNTDLKKKPFERVLRGGRSGSLNQIISEDGVSKQNLATNSETSGKNRKPELNLSKTSGRKRTHDEVDESDVGDSLSEREQVGNDKIDVDRESSKSDSNSVDNQRKSKRLSIPSESRSSSPSNKPQKKVLAEPIGADKFDKNLRKSSRIDGTDETNQRKQSLGTETSAGVMESNVKEQHSEKKMSKCELCNEEMKVTSLKRHGQSANHSKNVELKSDFDNLFRNPEKFIMSCSICDLSFPSPFLSYKHQLKNHEDTLMELIESSMIEPPYDEDSKEKECNEIKNYDDNDVDDDLELSETKNKLLSKRNLREKRTLKLDSSQDDKNNDVIQKSDDSSEKREVNAVIKPERSSSRQRKSLKADSNKKEDNVEKTIPVESSVKTNFSSLAVDTVQCEDSFTVNTEFPLSRAKRSMKMGCPVGDKNDVKKADSKTVELNESSTFAPPPTSSIHSSPAKNEGSTVLIDAGSTPRGGRRSLRMNSFIENLKDNLSQTNSDSNESTNCRSSHDVVVENEDSPDLNRGLLSIGGKRNFVIDSLDDNSRINSKPTEIDCNKFSENLSSTTDSNKNSVILNHELPPSKVRRSLKIDSSKNDSKEESTKSIVECKDLNSNSSSLNDSKIGNDAVVDTTLSKQHIAVAPSVEQKNNNEQQTSSPLQSNTPKEGKVMKYCEVCDRSVGFYAYKKHSNSLFHKNNLKLNSEFLSTYAEQTTLMFCEKCSISFTSTYFCYKHFVENHPIDVSETFDKKKETAASSSETAGVKPDTIAMLSETAGMKPETVASVSDMPVDMEEPATNVTPSSPSEELIENAIQFEGSILEKALTSAAPLNLKPQIEIIDLETTSSDVSTLNIEEKLPNTLFCPICHKRVKFESLQKHSMSLLHKSNYAERNFDYELPFDCDRCQQLDDCPFACRNHEKIVFRSKKKRRKNLGGGVSDGEEESCKKSFKSIGSNHTSGFGKSNNKRMMKLKKRRDLLRQKFGSFKSDRLVESKCNRLKKMKINNWQVSVVEQVDQKPATQTSTDEIFTSLLLKTQQCEPEDRSASTPGESKYNCLLCEEKFNSALLLVKHQNTPQHKYNESRSALKTTQSVKQALSNCSSSFNPALYKHSHNLHSPSAITPLAPVEIDNEMEGHFNAPSHGGELGLLKTANSDVTHTYNWQDTDWSNVRRASTWDNQSIAGSSSSGMPDANMLSLWETDVTSSFMGGRSSLGSILDSVNKILADPDVSTYPTYNLSELQSEVGTYDEDVALLQQQFGERSNLLQDIGTRNESSTTTSYQDNWSYPPSMEDGSTTLMDLDNQPPIPPPVQAVDNFEQDRKFSSTTSDSDSIITQLSNVSTDIDHREFLSKKQKLSVDEGHDETQQFDAKRQPALKLKPSVDYEAGASKAARPKKPPPIDYEAREIGCPFCGKHFLGLSAVQKHISHCSNNIGNKPGASSISWLKRKAMLSSAAAVDRRLVCLICKEILSSPESLQKHVTDEHPKNENQHRVEAPNDSINKEGAEKFKSKMSIALGSLLDKALNNLLCAKNQDTPPEFNTGAIQLLGKLCAVRRKSQQKLSTVTAASSASLSTPLSVQVDGVGGGGGGNCAVQHKLSKFLNPRTTAELRNFIADRPKLAWLAPNNDEKSSTSSAHANIKPGPLPSPNTLVDHLALMLTDGNPEENSYACPVCSEKFSIPSARNNHMYQVHDISDVAKRPRKKTRLPNEITAPTTDERPDTSHSNHSEKDWRTIASSSCDSDFGTENGDGESVIRPLCSDCNLAFPTIQDLIAHRKEDHPNSSRGDLPVSENIVDSTSGGDGARGIRKLRRTASCSSSGSSTDKTGGSCAVPVGEKALPAVEPIGFSKDSACTKERLRGKRESGGKRETAWSGKVAKTIHDESAAVDKHDSITRERDECDLKLKQPRMPPASQTPEDVRVKAEAALRELSQQKSTTIKPPERIGNRICKYESYRYSQLNLNLPLDAASNTDNAALVKARFASILDKKWKLPPNDGGNSSEQPKSASRCSDCIEHAEERSTVIRTPLRYSESDQDCIIIPDGEDPEIQPQ